MRVLDRFIADLACFKRGSRPEHERWKDEGVRAIVVCGSSGSGKTTLVNLIRRSQLAKSGVVEVPQRYITRPWRKNDDLEENVHVNAVEFDTFLAQHRKAFYWRRRFSSRRVERYGFAPSGHAALVVYSGNNALCQSALVTEPRGQLESALILGVYASREIRLARFCQRSPDLIGDYEEMTHRFAEDDQVAFELSHLVVNAEVLTPQQILPCMTTLCTRIVDNLRGLGEYWI